MFKFEIVNPEVEEINGVSARTQKPYSIRKQQARVAINGEVRNVNIVLNRDQPAYQKGMYRLGEESFFVGGFGDLQVRPVLEPIASTQQKAG